MADEQQGNIDQQYNLGRIGLNMDQTPNQINKGALTYALNAALENFDANSVNYQNEPGNELCFEFPEGYQLIGTHFINEKSKHVFFLANPSTGGSEIGYMDNNDCVYRTFINADCLNFNIDYPIHKAVHKITSCTTEIYWTDGLNSRRYLDLDDVTSVYKILPGTTVCDNQTIPVIDCNKLKIQPNFNIPQLAITDIITGGNLIAGTYQFAIQYSDATGSGFTSYYSVTNPTPIYDPNVITLDFNYQVGKSIVLDISNLDTTGKFEYFNIAVIKTINAISSVELIGTYFIDGSTRTITYTGQNVSDIRLTLIDIYQKYPYYDIAQDITTAQDILIWDNLTSVERLSYQKIANQIELAWETWRIPSSEDYGDELNATNLRGYLRDEVYAFEIVFLLRNGKQTDGFHIPGRMTNNYDNYPDVPNTNPDFIGEPDYFIGGIGYSKYWKIYNTGYKSGDSPGKSNAIGYKGPWEFGGFSYWESTEEYPCNEDVWGDLAGKKIRHHKFPDVLVSPIFENPQITYTPTGKYAPVMVNDAVYPIGVKVDVNQIANLIATSSLTQDQKDEIVGFKIVRGDRATNKSIVAKGILRNVGKYTRENTEYYYPNYPYNDLREDPFLLKESNAFQDGCKTYRIDCDPASTVDIKLEYLDCITNSTVTTTYPATSGSVYLCSQSFPLLAGGSATYIGLARYGVYRITNGNPFRGAHFYYIDPRTPGQQSIIWIGAWPGANSSKSGILSIIEPYRKDGSRAVDVDLLQTVAPPPGTQNCGDGDLEQLVGFDESARYRYVLNSPETSFGNPFLGKILKLESAIWGAGRAHFVEVKKHAMYKLLTKEAQEDAINDAFRIADKADPFDVAGMFTAYQTYLQIYINGVTRRNYTYSYNSIASYDYYSEIQNGLGIKQRPLDIAQYLISGVQSVGEEVSINNYNRESSVYLRTLGWDVAAPIAPLPFPDKTNSIAPGGVSLISDESRFTISQRGSCIAPEDKFDISVVSYYGSLKNLSYAQWGQIYTYDTIDTGFQVDLDTYTNSLQTMFGGDTFITRFAFKIKLPFFIDNRVGAPDDSDIFYDEIGNVAYPKYWYSARSVLSDVYPMGGGYLLTNFISYKAHFFDCPNKQVPKSPNPGRTYYDGKMYLFAYGIPNFYCETSYNVDLRQAFNNREGDFWPHVGTGIPDDWVQESYVPIAQDNTYYYNVTYSKQNKENVFTHLPVDWTQDLCRTTFPFRAIYSDPQQGYTAEDVNAWLIYRPISAYDFPQNYGKLTSLDGIQNRAVLARFENKTLLYNNLLTIDTSNPQAAYVGNNKLFDNQYPPIDYADTDLGYVGSQHKLLMKIPQGQITIDAKRGQIFLLTGEGAKDLSGFGSGLNRFFTDHLAFEILRYFPKVNVDNHFKGIGLHGVFDSKYERVIITKLDYIPLSSNVIYDETDQEFYYVETINGGQRKTLIYVTDEEYFCNKSWSISYNFNTGSWVSFHSYIPNWYIAENNFFYSGLNGSCFIEAIAAEVEPDPSTTTTTTTDDPNGCNCLQFYNFSGGDSDISFRDCEGNVIDITLGSLDFYEDCGNTPVYDSTEVLFVRNGPCVFNIGSGAYVCGTTTTTTTTSFDCTLVGTASEIKPKPITTTTTSSSSTTTTTTTLCPTCNTYRITNKNSCEITIDVTTCSGITRSGTVEPNESIIVCVCDTAPYVENFIIDLLYEGACVNCFCYTVKNNSTAPQIVYWDKCESYGAITIPMSQTLSIGESICICAAFDSPSSDSTDVLITGGNLLCAAETACGTCGHPCAPGAITLDSIIDECPCEVRTYSVPQVPAFADHLVWIAPDGTEIVSQTNNTVTLRVLDVVDGFLIVYAVSPCGYNSESISLYINSVPCTTTTTTACPSDGVYFANNASDGEISDVQTGGAGIFYTLTTGALPITSGNYASGTLDIAFTDKIIVSINVPPTTTAYLHLQINCVEIGCIQVPAGVSGGFTFFNVTVGLTDKLAIYFDNNSC